MNTFFLFNAVTQAVQRAAQELFLALWLEDDPHGRVFQERCFLHNMSQHFSADTGHDDIGDASALQANQTIGQYCFYLVAESFSGQKLFCFIQWLRADIAGITSSGSTLLHEVHG